MIDMMLKQALKEWDVVINALVNGETILLMRKGGLREPRGHFVESAQPVLLYPTYEHQRSDRLKPAYANRVKPVPPGWHPAQVTIRAMAEITDVLTITQAESLVSLNAWHIWQPDFAIERWRWKPDHPLSILCLRAFILPQPQAIAYQPHYAGCRSWLELDQPVDITNAQPVFDRTEYREQVAQIRTICHV